ncbi:MAG: prepilin peptidase [Sphingobacteriaceae bacterium]
MIYLLIGIFICSAGIAYQDIKSREISLWLILIFAGFVFWRTYLKSGLELIGYQFLFSVCYLFISLALIKLYFILTKRGHLRLFEQLFGWGDVLVLIAVGIGLPVEIQIPFYLVCFILAIIGYYLIQSIKTSIPLAVYLVLTYCAYLLMFS